jgi:hypothetical protein
MEGVNEFAGAWVKEYKSKNCSVSIITVLGPVICIITAV